MEVTMHLDQMTRAYARLAIGQAGRALLYDPNIGLIDFGHPERQGTLDEDDVAIRVHVRQKLSGIAFEQALESGQTRPVPPTIAGFRTDVLEGTYRPHWWWGTWWQPPPSPRARRAEPMAGGLSISDAAQYTYGTLGGLVIDRATGAEMILSNWHVLAGRWIARPSLATYQPGRLDGGSAADTVARLTRHGMAVNIDAAVATLTGSRQLINDQLELGPVQGVTEPELGMAVVKSGRKTGLTYGRVIAMEGIAKLTYDSVQRVIRKVVTIEPQRANEQVSAGGDSGSWWLDQASMRAVALHFAGSDYPERALAIDMPTVLATLQVDLAYSIALPAWRPARVAVGV
jgi:endonuclease G